MDTLTQTLDRRSCEEAETAFEVGFQTAMQMLAAGLSMPAKTPKKGEDIK